MLNFIQNHLNCVKHMKYLPLELQQCFWWNNQISNDFHSLYKIMILQEMFKRINSSCYQWCCQICSRSWWNVTMIKHMSVCLGWRKFCQSVPMILFHF
jgi:hypothetical protein